MATPESFDQLTTLPMAEQAVTEAAPPRTCPAKFQSAKASGELMYAGGAALEARIRCDADCEGPVPVPLRIGRITLPIFTEVCPSKFTAL